MERSTKWELVPAHFGPLWSYIEDDEITDIDFNGMDLWITNTANERIKVEEHGVTKEFIEKFSHYIANNVSKPFNKVENLLEAGRVASDCNINRPRGWNNANPG